MSRNYGVKDNMHEPVLLVGLRQCAKTKARLLHRYFPHQTRGSFKHLGTTEYYSLLGLTSWQGNICQIKVIWWSTVINSIFNFSIQDTKEPEGKKTAKNKMFRKKSVAPLKLVPRPKIQPGLFLPHHNIFLVSQFTVRSGSQLFLSVSSWALWKASFGPSLGEG